MRVIIPQIHLFKHPSNLNRSKLPQNKNISFTSIDETKECTKDFNGNKVGLRNTTTFFRNDLDWDRLTDYIISEYPPGTTIYNFACSDGSEPYSLKLLLDKKLNQDSSKIYPIKAIDIDPKNIEKINKREIGIQHTFEGYLDKSDIDKIEEFLGPNGINNFKKTNESIDKNHSKYIVSEELFNSIDFQVGDITKWAKTPQKKPCIVLFRNAWPYLEEDTSEKLVKDLSKNLMEGSILVTGSFEYNKHYKEYKDYKLRYFLHNNKFEPLSQFRNLMNFTWDTQTIVYKK